MNLLVKKQKSQFFTRYLLYINYLFVGALLLSYLASYVNPNTFWGFSFFGLSYPIFLIFNLLFILIWIYRRKIYLLISLFAILIGYVHIGEFIQFNTNDADNNPDAISLLSFNAQNFSEAYSGIFSKSVQKDAFDFFEKENADILCIQEYSYKGENVYASHLQLKERLKANNYFFESYFNPKNTRVVGMVTFSKYPIVGKGIFDLKDTRKFAIYTDLLIKKDTIRLYNIHLESIRLNTNDYKYLTQHSDTDSEYKTDSRKIIKKLTDAYQKRARQVDVLSKHMSKSPYPIVMCGDFNDTPVSYAYQNLSRNLTDAFEHNGSGLGKTLIGKIPAFRIDFILMDESLTSLSYEELKLELSDHYPIKSSFRLP